MPGHRTRSTPNDAPDATDDPAAAEDVGPALGAAGTGFAAVGWVGEPPADPPQPTSIETDNKGRISAVAARPQRLMGPGRARVLVPTSGFLLVNPWSGVDDSSSGLAG